MPAPDYEHRLDVLEQQGVENKNRLLHVERSVDIIGRQVVDLGGKLDTVVHAVTTVTAQPRFDIFKILPAAAAVVVIVTAIGGVITYISSNIAAVTASKIEAQTARMDERQSFLQMRLDNGWFKPSAMTIRAPGGAVTPQ